MEKSKLQSFIFTAMMALVMVYAMICYNIALNIGGMSNQVFLLAFHELIIMWPIAIILEWFLVEKSAHYLVSKIVDFRNEKPYMITLLMSGIIVCIMCPIMSMVATALFQNAGSEMIAKWLQTTVFNFPMALFWQICYCGPLVRKLERIIF